MEWPVVENQPTNPYGVPNHQGPLTLIIAQGQKGHCRRAVDGISDDLRLPLGGTYALRPCNLRGWSIYLRYVVADNPLRSLVLPTDFNKSEKHKSQVNRIRNISVRPLYKIHMCLLRLRDSQYNMKKKEINQNPIKEAKIKRSNWEML